MPQVQDEHDKPSIEIMLDVIDDYIQNPTVDLAKQPPTLEQFLDEEGTFANLSLALLRARSFRHANIACMLLASY